MKFNRILAGLLAVIMAVSSFGYVAAVPVSAAYEDKVDEEGNPLIDYILKPYYTKEQKLQDMVLMKEENGYQIWVEEFTGEIAFIDASTGEALFTNPYDIASSFTNMTAGSISKAVKQKLLSQIILTYEDNGATKTMNSYVEAALRGQINIKNIKGGVRVEYTMGEQEVTRLVPRIISKERFETLIYANIEASGDLFVKRKFDGFYSLKDKNDPSLSKKALNEMFTKFPITQKMAVYVCSPEITSNELYMLEGWIKQYCPLYTYEEMDYDHEETGYVGTDEAPPLFRLALEYKIQKDGSLEVRLPANGIRYDETAYTLKDISILPYMGAGSNEDKGYSFVPDGTGTLYRFEDLIGTTYNKAAQLYGDDYAYHTISENSVHSEVWRYPVFGVVSYADRTIEYEEILEPGYTAEDGTVVPPVTEKKTVEIDEDKGYVAIITEGDSLTTLFSENGGTQHPYSSVYPKFTPHPSDSYNLADSISVADNKTWTVTSESKFTGSYRIKYIMLHDEEKVPVVDSDKLYECSYVGMAKAYRSYLYESGQLNQLTDSEVTAATPLFIESFGSIKTVERVASFPVTVDTPLTTFEDIKTMYDELAAEGISNISFRLKGFANGGMVSTVPYKISWVDAVGGKEGFEDLVKYAGEKGFGVYPDFDFAYASSDEIFDGLSYRDHAVKTIDNRYSTKQTYDAAMQTFQKTTLVAISPSVYNYFFETFAKNYEKYSPMGVSVSTLGTDLNSDFDEDDPYNREDCREFTTDLLANLKDKFGKVMVDGGNAYTFPYADMIVNISTDSSNFMVASEAVPFLGIVLHGSILCAGEPINMEGDVYYAILKAIENGYYLNFTLSYRNTEKLKDDEQLASFYSVKYEYWKEDLIKYYNMLNDATKDLQTSLITDHEFLSGSRHPDADESEADAAAFQAVLDAAATILRNEALRVENEQKLEDRLNGKPVDSTSSVGDLASFYEQAMLDATVVNYLKSVEARYATTQGSLVRVEYEGDVSFILNYNSFEIDVNYNGQTYKIPALSFERIG